MRYSILLAIFAAGLATAAPVAQPKADIAVSKAISSEEITADYRRSTDSDITLDYKREVEQEITEDYKRDVDDDITLDYKRGEEVITPDYK